jgi:molybdate transport system substrate-binding protein
MVRLFFAFVVCAVVSVNSLAQAQTGNVTVAVAVNFLEPMRRITAAYTKSSGQDVRIVSGSTGGLYAKIRHGAPYDAFLSADQERPRRLEAEGLAAPGTRFTYAIGRLALWTRSKALAVDIGPETLRRGAFDHIALANPAVAPYGAAAMQTLQALGVASSLKAKLVWGQSIGQTYQFIATGSAPVGFVALSQLRHPTQKPGGAWWIAPDNLHAPLKQDVVALAGGSDFKASKALLLFLRSDQARAIIQRFGYDVAPRPVIR